MLHKLEFRLSTFSDASAIMELDKLVWDESTTPGQINWRSKVHFLETCPPGSQLVAVIGDKLCGYLGFAPPTPLTSNRHVYDINIAVHPDYQGQGVGQGLMSQMKELAQEQGIRKLSLRVLATNQRAITFYKQCGFMEQGRLVAEFYLQGKYVDDILMYYLLMS
ncbi:N-acyltransferase YncA [compost metagenome]